VSVKKLDILFEFKEGDPPKLGGGLKFKPNAEIGQNSNLWMGTD